MLTFALSWFAAGAAGLLVSTLRGCRRPTAGEAFICLMLGWLTLLASLVMGEPDIL